MKLENNQSFFDNEFQAFWKNGYKSHDVSEDPLILGEQTTDIPFTNNEKEKLRVLSVLLADFKWTINTDCKVTYISPFIENCLGNDAGLVIKHLLSNYLTPSAIISCLIELEELKEIMRTFKNTEPRKLVAELLPNKSNFEKIEITSSTVFDLKGNVVGISGLCNFIL